MENKKIIKLITTSGEVMKPLSEDKIKDIKDRYRKLNALSKIIEIQDNDKVKYIIGENILGKELFKFPAAHTFIFYEQSIPEPEEQIVGIKISRKEDIIPAIEQVLETCIKFDIIVTKISMIRAIYDDLHIILMNELKENTKLPNTVPDIIQFNKYTSKTGYQVDIDVFHDYKDVGNIIFEYII